MKSTLFVLVMLVFAGAVYAQGTGPDLMVPYVNSALITIDGQGTDWENPAVYPVAYVLSTTDAPEYFGLVTGSAIEGPEDFSAVLYLGWSTDNMLYGYSRVTDDLLKVGVPTNGACWGEDDLEIMTDPTNTGGLYRTAGSLDANPGQQFGIRLKQGVPMGPGGNENESRNHIWGYAEAEWTTGAAYFVSECDYGTGETDVTYAYEWKLALWDVVGLSPAESQRHDNLASYNSGAAIGLGIAWDDSDVELATRDSQIGTMGPDGNAFWNNADHFNDAYLVANPLYDVVVAVEASSWGAVKASLK